MINDFDYIFFEFLHLIVIPLEFISLTYSQQCVDTGVHHPKLSIPTPSDRAQHDWIAHFEFDGIEIQVDFKEVFEVFVLDFGEFMLCSFWVIVNSCKFVLEAKVAFSFLR